MPVELKAILNGALKETGLQVENPETVEKLELYLARMSEKNAVMNLTAIRDESEAVVRHFADSIAASAFLTVPSRMIDVGCGAGFPGLPLKIFWECEKKQSVNLTLLDSTAKKIGFLRELCAEACFENINFETRRAEEAGHDPLLRESFDLCVARAVTAYPALCEICLPFVKTGGFFAAHKSSRSSEEISAGRAINGVLGGGSPVCESYTVNGTESVLVISRKLKATPSKFPRSWKVISSKAPTP